MRPKLFVILLALAVLVYFLTIHHRSEGVKEGDPAPGFTLPAREGSISLVQFRGQVVLLNFWATWCPPCVTEMPSLDDLRKRVEGRAVQILAVSLDEEGWEAIDRFLEKMPVGFKILLDARGEVSNRYGVTYLPETYLIDSKGIIVKKYVGPQDWNDLWNDSGVVEEVGRER